MLKVVDFLKNGHSLQELAGAPYYLKIQEQDNLVLLKYNQIDSDLSNSICQECRGIIFDKTTWQPVCFPFTKFFNYGEPNAAELHGKISVYQKVDGSLCKVWYYNNEWHLSSNSVIDAATVNVGEVNFYQLFEKCLATYKLNWNSFTLNLDKNYTYMYEMATQDNRVVIPYNGYHLFYLGQRNNITGIEEYRPNSRIENVKVYNFNTVDEVIAAANELPNTEEGYVVRDDSWNRVKIKNPVYFSLHHMINNGNPNLLARYLNNDMDEILAYFPDLKKDFDAIDQKFRMIKEQVNSYVQKLSQFKNGARKDYALALQNMNIPKVFYPYLFKVYEKNDLTWDDFTKQWDENKWKQILKEI